MKHIFLCGWIDGGKKKRSTGQEVRFVIRCIDDEQKKRSILHEPSHRVLVVHFGEKEK